MPRVGIKLAILELGLLAFFIAGTRTQQDRPEFSYRKGPRGPENWGNLKKEWSLCKTGKHQSPIDVLDGDTELDLSLAMARNYRPANATLVNEGHYMQLNWSEGGGTILIDGKRYTLRQCHWHHPSEHKVDGKQYDLELHMVHQSNDGVNAVVGILYQYGEPDPFLAGLTEQLQSIANTREMEEDVGIVDPMQIDVRSWKYFRYSGSLTTPPCNESVVWTIVKRVMTVSREQVELLREAVNDDYPINARPIQPRNGRIIRVFSFYL